MGFLGYYADLAKAETEQAERATLPRLQVKYDTSSQPSALLPPSQIQSPLSIQLQPLTAVRLKKQLIWPIFPMRQNRSTPRGSARGPLRQFDSHHERTFVQCQPLLP
jgi:hypothetical protein